MAQGKSRWDFQMSNPQDAQNIMTQFLQINNFKQMMRDGLVYYKYVDHLSGNCFVEYYISGTTLTILAYVHNPKSPHMIDDDMMMWMPKQMARGLLNTLFQEIDRINNNPYNQPVSIPNNQPAYEPQPTYYQQPANYQQPAYSQQNYQNNQPNNSYNPAYQPGYANAFQDNYNKRNGTMAIIGFVMSLIAFCVSFSNIIVGVYIIQICLAIQGLKSNKKGFSIATFVLTGLNLIVIAGYLLITFA